MRPLSFGATRGLVGLDPAAQRNHGIRRPPTGIAPPDEHRGDDDHGEDNQGVRLRLRA